MSIQHEYAWRDAITAMAERNAAVELVYPDPDGSGGPRRIKRCRLLAADEAGLWVERPAAGGGGGGVLLVGQAGAADEVELVVTHRGQRWVAHCRVAGAENFRLAGGGAVGAFRLHPPHHLEWGQRRQFFRVHIGSGDASLELAIDRDAVAEGTTLPTNLPDRLDASLLNLSAGGVGVSAELNEETVEVLRTCRGFRCTLRLAGHATPIDLPAKLIHIEPLARGQVYLGLEFVFDCSTFCRMVQDAIGRLATEIQRRQLRLQRGA
jgi:c-di-GMP-binding flagellar brake protein YcgR